MYAAILLLGCSAPAPRPAPPLRPADLVGTWRMTWYDCTDACVFRADGTLSYYWRQEHWEGAWRLDRTTLSIDTWRATESPETHHVTQRYAIGPLERTRKGVTCGSWKLER